MIKIIKKIDAFISKICGSMSYGASAMILVVMVIVCSDVFMRGVFNTPIIGVVEIIRMALPVIAFFMFPWATHLIRHVRSLMLYTHMPPRARLIIDVAAYSAGVCMFILVVYASWPDLFRSISLKEFEGDGALRVVTWPTRALIIFSSVMIAWQMARCAVLAIKNHISKKVSEKGVLL